MTRILLCFKVNKQRGDAGGRLITRILLCCDGGGVRNPIAFNMPNSLLQTPAPEAIK